MISAANQTTAAPRPAAFKAVVIGLTMLIVVLGIITTVSRAATPYFGPTWVPMTELLLAGGFLAGLALMWFRHSLGFYLYCGLFGLKVILLLSIGVPLTGLLIDAVLFAILLWCLHVGGMQSMWRQMFGDASSTQQSGAYGFQPAMPPGLSPRPAPPSMPAAAPLPNFAPVASGLTPAPRATAPGAAAPVNLDDPVEQIKTLAALRDAGVLTEGEFAAKKSELLKRL